MRKLAQALMDLQELELVRQESAIVHGKGADEKAADLDPEIRTLRAAVPPVILHRFDGYRRQHGAAVVREKGGVCLGCHLAVPQGDLNRMRREEIEWLCPNCGRFLLLSD
jgi:predicted  nucleic acid-binding Zn-ribbon protein